MRFDFKNYNLLVLKNTLNLKVKAYIARENMLFLKFYIFTLYSGIQNNDCYYLSNKYNNNNIIKIKNG